MEENFKKNFSRPCAGYRYSTEMKLYSSYIRMISGRILYTTLKANAKCSLPSNTSVKRYIAHYKVDVIEGQLRVKEFVDFLEKQNLSRFVHLSEDATKITGRVQYDSRNNKIVGCVLPLDSQTGMPVTDQNEAVSARSIENCFYEVDTKQQKPQASYVNVVMAQSLSKESPPFCLLLFGTNGSFTKEDVSKRWIHITNVLSSHNVTVVTFSSDSDPRYNSVMRMEFNLGQHNREWPNWFNVQTNLSYIPIQDTVHIGTKLRNRLLNQSLLFGTHLISIAHLIALVRAVPKAEHKLSENTVNTSDRQNFDSVLAICDDKVISLLALKIKDSQGTILYLRIINNILKSFLDPRLLPLERVRHIWTSNFLLRIWRKFIMESNHHTLGKHFITNNCYICVEINAHALIQLIVYLKEKNISDLFSTEKVGSQPCESIFRQFRSFTPTYSTMVNCSLLEMIQRISKIELQNDITHIRLKHFIFPNIGIPSSTIYPKTNRNGEISSFNSLPDTHEIFEEIEMAKLEALEYAESLGVVVGTDLICTLKPHEVLSESVDLSESMDPTNPSESIDAIEINPIVSDESNEPVEENSNHTDSSNPNILKIFGDVNFRNYSAKNINPDTITPTSLYVKIESKDGEKYILNKHTLCWLMSQSTNRLSSDRLRRVMGKSS